MTNILITLTAIAAFLTIRAVRIMRHNQKQTRSFSIPFDAYAIEYERETKRRLAPLFYQADMERKYGR